MKRSEAIKLIVTAVYQASDMDVELSKEEAAEVLQKLEDAGMLPDDYDGTIFGYNEGYISPPKWEPET